MQIRKEELEKCVINAIVGQLSSPDIMDKMVNKLVQLQNTEETVSSALTMLLNEKHGVERSLANLVNAIENGIISNTTNNRLQELEKRQEELNGGINQVLTPPDQPYNKAAGSDEGGRPELDMDERTTDKDGKNENPSPSDSGGDSR